MLAAAGVQETGVTHAEAVMPAKSNSNSMTATIAGTQAKKSRNESNNRTAIRVGTPTRAGMLAKLVKLATACREANNNMESESDIIATAVEKPATFSRNASNSNRTSQLL